MTASLSHLARTALLSLALLLPLSLPARAMPPEVLQSVVSVQPQGAPARSGEAPEGSGVVIATGVVATAAHVLGASRDVLVRLSDGRVLEADVIASDMATDIALLSVGADLPPLPLAEAPALAEPVCAVGNSYGLGLSVTCGVVSALDVTDAGFNAVEHFVQTDAAINPGGSGGALVDRQGRLVGLVSAIFASQSDSNIGMNFAVSTALLDRVASQLLAEGEVTLPRPGWQLVPPGRDVLARIAAPVIGRVVEGSPAAAADLRAGDLLLRVDGVRVRTGRDVRARMALLAPDRGRVPLAVERDGAALDIVLDLSAPDAAPPSATTAAGGSPADPDCPFAEAVCRMRQAVFPVSALDPLASATRIGPDLMVTNRHVIGDRREATILTPEGPRPAEVIASDYAGDMVLLRVPGLPAGAPVFDPSEGTASGDGLVQAIGADISRREVRVFPPGERLSDPAPDAPLGRLHVAAPMQPGVSGGALVAADGTLAGIAVGGGEGRFEAIPLAQVRRLLDGRAAPGAAAVTARLGTAFTACQGAIDAARAAAPPDRLEPDCAEARNAGQLLEAGRVLARAGEFDGSVRLMEQSVAQVPHSLNARLSLLVALQLGARFEAMIPHARFVLERAGGDAGALRFAIQAGVWGGDMELAEDGYAALLAADPAQAQAARRFIDGAPPAPPRR